MTTDLAKPDAGTGADDEDLDVDLSARPARRPGRIVGIVVLVLALLAGGGLIGRWFSSGGPQDTSVEAGFARDMRSHHAQAVSMAMVEYQRSSDPELRAVAYDIALGQQREIGILDGWLQSWNLSANSATPPMTWMTDGGHGHGTMTGMPAMTMPGPTMPGMATPAEIGELNTASGRTLDQLFLNFMIRHHQGGLQMAQAALDRSDNELVHRFAQRVVINQNAEIEQMQRDLAARPA